MKFHKSVTTIINALMLCSMLFGLIAPAAQLGVSAVLAQESTEEATEPPATETPLPTATATLPPTSTPTDEPTEAAPASEEAPIVEETAAVVVEPEVTEAATPAPESTEVAAPPAESTETVAPEATEEATTPVEATEQVTQQPEITETVNPSEEATETATPPATPPAEMTVFTDDFEDGSADGWSLSPGWAVAADGNNMVLRGVIPGATAEVSEIDWPDLNLTARLRVQPGSTAEISIRKNDTESYRVVVDADGLATLYRGDAQLAQGTAVDTETTQAIWRTISIQAFGSQIVVSLDDVVQFTFDDPAPLGAGAIVFSTGADNTGAVDLDDVTITRLDTPVIVTEPAPEVTEEATAAAETTAEPEATQEPEATDEPAPEATEEPTSPELQAVPVLSADFEGELSGWVASEGAVVVAVTDDNKALLMNGGDSLLPASITEVGDFRLDARLNFVNATSGSLSILFRNQDGSSYVLGFEGAQTVLYRSSADESTPLVSVPAAHDVNTWHDLSLSAVGNTISLAVNGEEEFSYTDTDEAALTSGEIALVANGETSFLLDDLTLYDLVAGGLPTPTPLPVATLTEELGQKLPDALYQVLRLYEDGDQAGALELATTYNIAVLDDTLNVNVILWPAEGLDTLMAAVEAQGGVVTAINEKNLNVRIPLPNLVPLIAMEDVLAVRLPDVAASTDSTYSAAASPAEQGGNPPDSLAIIGWNDWHNAGIAGAAVKVAVIDKGGTHRAAVAGLIQTIAPGATITQYTATNVDNLDDQIQAARNGNNKIILITMDLGAHVSPGDGTGSNGTGQGAANAVYSQIHAARAEGRLVIVSAGNNTGSYVSFPNPNGAVVTMTVDEDPYIVDVGWDGWGNTNVVPSTLSISGGGSVNSPSSRLSSEAPGYQFTGNCGAPCTLTLTFTGGGAGDYVQVQLNSPGSITNVTGATVDANAGNIGRPADSPDALAVGAVCSAQYVSTVLDKYYQPMYDSSHGPIFASGGTGAGPDTTTNTRADYKPDLVAPSHVYVPQYGTPNYECDNFHVPTSGFNGTSASAAHVAGMAALLLSNNSMAAKIKNAPNPADALQNYLQTHTVDLFDVAADGFAGDYGFDNVFGAGLTELGSPSYNLGLIANPLGAGGNAVYVGQADPGSIQDGTFDHPFIHIAKAIDVADDISTPNRIVILPGEYLSGVPVINRTDISLEGYNNLATMWVNDTYKGRGGIEIEGSTAITIDGLVFNAAHPLAVSGGYSFAAPLAVQFLTPAVISGGSAETADGSVVRNSTFSGFTSSEPVNITGTFGLSIMNNTFENINVQAVQLDRAAMYIYKSNSDTDPVIVRGNTFRNITGTVQPNTDPNREAIIRVEESSATFVSNFFLNDKADTVLNITNAVDADTEAVNIASNLFLNNFNVLVYLNSGPRTRFINNTVVGQSQQTGDTALLLRKSSGDLPWGVHNNLFYNNPGYRIIQHLSFFSLCQAIGESAPPPGTENGARNNWVINSQSTFGSGTCDKSFQIENPPGSGTFVAQNNNIISTSTIPAAQIFVGPDPLFGLNPNSDPLYYQLREDAVGIDKADNALLVPPLIDFAGHIRYWDGDGLNADEADLGAFELVPLTAGPIDVTRIEDVFDQPNDHTTAFAIDLRDGVEGGFAPYTFKIKTYPVNFSTDPSDFCLGAGVRIEGNYAYYCPPDQFYTDGTPGDPNNLPDDVQFEYYAFDRISDQNDLTDAKFSTVTVNITSDILANASDPTVALDDPLTTPINYQFITEAGSAFKFRLRPWVRFNNFRFSEYGTTRRKQSQYPFTYNTDITLLPPSPGDPDFDSYNPAILEDGGLGLEAYIEDRMTNPNADGTITLQSKAGERGYIQFSYQVTDSSSSPSTITNTIRLQVEGSLPDRGLHDDSSFNFKYGTTSGTINGWIPLASTANINNTLHQTARNGDVATFDFVGESFVLYMQAISRGALWQLRIDDKAGVGTALTWVKQSDGSWEATADGFNCVTRAPVANNLISNNGRTLYTVSCDGLRDGESHSVQIINRQAAKLAVDAIAIAFDTDPLLPGVHEVTEHDLFTTFAGWKLVQDGNASSGVALAAPSDQISDIVFTFSGTGIAFGTTLEGARVGKTSTYLGADYDICITPQVGGVGGEEVCQNFNNATGTGLRPTWNVFRPFFGYSYNPLDASPDVQTVRIHINDIPSGARFIIDSIAVFGDRPTEPLSLDNRTVEDDQIGPIVFGNGKPNSWSLNTSDRSASNRSLTSLATRVIAAGPFISFEIPDDADVIHWYRKAGKRDSQSILVCVDRAQGEAGVTDHCLPYNLRTAPNPLIVRESDFAGGWGDAWTSTNVHTVEIFSLTNEAFNFDKVEIFDNDAPLPAGHYEDYVMAANDGVFGFFDAANTINGGTFSILQNSATRRASGGSVAQTDVANEGVLFQMHGTGFTARFTQERFSGDARICWLAGATTDVANVETNGNCQTHYNYSYSPRFNVGYTTVGLPEGDYTVTIRNLLHVGHRMQFDGVDIVDDALPGNVLTATTTRYETSFVHRAENDMFLYYGNWRGYEGRPAARYSGQNYDYVSGDFGAALVFQTQGVDTLQINRTARTGYANMQICVDGGVNCLIIPGNRTPAVVHLSNLVVGAFSMVDPHVVSIALTSSGRFYLDSIDVFDSTTPLPQGMYEDSEPLLKYDTTWNDKVSAGYTNRHAQRTVSTDATMLFHMQGSILELGMFVKSYNQAEICYQTGIEIDPTAASWSTATCENFPANSGQSLLGRKVYMSAPFSGGVATYTVRVRNRMASELLIDYLQIMDDENPLPEGRYENDHPILMAGRNNGAASSWTTIPSKNSSDGSYLRTQVANDFLQFNIEGTGFGIGTFNDRFGSEMQVCYLLATDTFDGDPDGVGEECVTFQNEALRSSTSITRAISGLPHDIYTVVVFNLDDTNTQLTNPPSPRNEVTYPPTLVVDFVEVYDNLPALLASDNPGTFNDNATDGGGDAFMQLLPADRWRIFTDRSARAASNGSYAAVVDSLKRLTSIYAGQSAVFQVELPANSTSTFVLDLFSGDRRNSNQLQYCVVGETSTISINCATLTTAQTERYQAISLENSTGSTVTRTISFSNLTPGFFRIDNFQFIPGNILGGGLYEDTLIGTPDLFDTGASTGWAKIPNRGYSNGSFYQTQVEDDSLQFTFSGTGFSVATNTAPTGSEMEICYQTAADFASDPTFPAGQCTTFQNQIARGSIKVSRTIAGLPDDTYVAGIFNRNDDPLRDLVRFPVTLIIDSIEVFDDALPPALGLTDGGAYNEDATASDEHYLQLLPATGWTEVGGRAGQNASHGSYAGVVDSRGRISTASVGPAALMRVTVAANDMATITLDTYASGSGHSNQLQFCILGGASALALNCDVLGTMTSSQFQVVTINNTEASDTTYSLFFQTLTPGYFRIDGFHMLQGTTLSAGKYEDIYIAPDGLIDANGSGWQKIVNRAYSSGAAWRTMVADRDLTPGDSGDFLQFEFHGTGFAIGTEMSRFGSEMQVCYVPTAAFDGNFFDDTGEQCLTFQNESARTYRDVMRSVTGLPEDTYTVSVIHKDDGKSNLSSTPVNRSSSYPATLIVDFVQVFNEPAPAVLSTSGTFNENAADTDPYLQLLPAERWMTIAGRAASRASNQSYVSVVDSRNRITRNAAGPSATMRLQVNADSSATLALNTYASGTGHSNQLMYCVLNAEVIVECNTLNSMPVSANQVITIDNPGGSPVTYTVFFQTLTPGYFRIDGFQTIMDGILTEGLYDTYFMSNGGIIDLQGSWKVPPLSGTKVRGAIGSDVVLTQTKDNTMTFTFTGTGFSILTVEDPYRLGIEVCYVTKAQYDIDEFASDKVICHLNSTQITRGAYTRYGLDFYGLEPDTYVARVTVDKTATDLRRQWFRVDALVIFGDVTASGALQPGMYDDADLLDNPAVSFAPAELWSAKARVRLGPPRGPWNLTQQETPYSGAVLQVFVEGNVLTLYQEFSTRNSTDVQACLVVYGIKENELLCGHFSQAGRGGFFTPVAFFGLGDGDHHIIFENKSPNRRFTVDGLRVTP